MLLYKDQVSKQKKRKGQESCNGQVAAVEGKAGAQYLFKVDSESCILTVDRRKIF